MRLAPALGLAAVAAVTAVGSFALLERIAGDDARAPAVRQRRAACDDIAAEARSASPLAVAGAFLRSAVIVSRPACARALVTERLRGRQLQRYRTTSPGAVRSEIVTRVDLPDQHGSWITLGAPDAKARVFEIVLVRRDDRWLVDYWARAVGFD